MIPVNARPAWNAYAAENIRTNQAYRLRPNAYASFAEAVRAQLEEAIDEGRVVGSWTTVRKRHQIDEATLRDCVNEEMADIRRIEERAA